MERKKDLVVVFTGPAGVGKDTLIKELVRKDHTLKWVPKYTNRLLRDGEGGRLYATDVELNDMEKAGKVSIVTNRFGIKIAEPLLDIKTALAEGLTPITDHYIKEVSDFRFRIGVAVFNIYVIPPSLEELKKRLERVGRADRFERESSELSEVLSGRFSKEIDMTLINGNLEISLQGATFAIKTVRSR